MKKEDIKSAINLIFIIGLFIFLSYLAQNNLDFFNKYLDAGFLGMLVFIIILALSDIFVPISAIPLFPLASGIWGWVIAGILGVIGWTIGSIIAFILTRKYGIDLVKHFLPLKEIYRFEKKIPEEHLFLTVVFLRMVIPVDGVSYLVGLFTKMKLKSYTLATIIGLIPFSFVVAYIGSIPFYYEIIFLLMALVIFSIGLLIAYYKKRKKEKLNLASIHKV